MDASSLHWPHSYILTHCSTFAANTDGTLTPTVATVHSVKVNCENFSKLSRLSILPDQHGIPDSGNLFCEMLRTSNEEMKRGRTMTDHGQRVPYRGGKGLLTESWLEKTVGYDRKEGKTLADTNKVEKVCKYRKRGFKLITYRTVKSLHYVLH